MFTGIVEELGETLAAPPPRLVLRAPAVAGGAIPGDSVAVNGVCLTVAERAGDRLGFDLSSETLGRSALGGLAAGDPVNLERAATPSTRLGGHLVQGHVDGVGELLAREGELVSFGVPPGLARYLVEKGSVTVDGVSLTAFGVTECAFTVSLVPQTLRRTTLGTRRPGDRVNIEVDVLAKYVEKLLAARA